MSAAHSSLPILSEPTGSSILELDDLFVHYPIRQGLLRREVGRIRAVDGVSFGLRRHETLGLVGESGCGKSTIGRAIMRINPPTGGVIRFDGQDIARLSGSTLRDIRRRIQIVFQDPRSSLNPRLTVHQLIAEPLTIWKTPPAAKEKRIADLLEQVSLSRGYAKRLPHELSGGQRQRIAIARALALQPDVLVLDEPVSALDVSVQAQVTGLLQELQETLGLAYLFISHDLSVVHHLSHRVAVMYLGRIVETGTRDQIFDNPHHPYTRALLSAVPIADPVGREARERIVLTGDVPIPSRIPSGCRFRTRCWKATEICATEQPPLVQAPRTTHPVACHHPESVV